MSRFYRELHDRELLVQAENTLGELHRRGLIDVLLPVSDGSAEERRDDIIFPRRFSSLEVRDGRLVLTVEDNFFSRSR